MADKDISVREAGRRGGKKTAERHGHDFFEEIGRKGGKRLRELVELGKEQEKLDEPSPRSDPDQKSSLRSSGQVR